MRFPTPLYAARLIKRYKRFLADVTLEEGPDSGATLTVHCPNPGSMMGLARPGARIYVSKSPNPKRKLAYTYEVEAVEGPGPACLVGINTMYPNKLAEEGITVGLVPSLNGFHTLKREQRYGENSRIDILLEWAGGKRAYVEVKNVHLMREAGHLEFPDSVTSRGAKHLRELASMVREGHRAVMLYVAQWPGAQSMGIAADIDPKYAQALHAAVDAGVEIEVLDCRVSTDEIVPVGSLTFRA